MTMQPFKAEWVHRPDWMPPETRGELEAALKKAEERREANLARATLDVLRLHTAADEAKAAIAKLQADGERAEAQAFSEDEAAVKEIERLREQLAALPPETET